MGVGLSGGADSVALLLALAERSRELGLVLHAAHLHHGLRGAEADGDLEFCRELAARLKIPFHEARVDTAAEAEPRGEKSGGAGNQCSEFGSQSGEAGCQSGGAGDQFGGAGAKAGESIEEAARRLRYLWFRRLLSEVPLDAVATAHTVDDQAETVIGKILRGAWTEGLSGIHPVLEFPDGKIIRPLLETTRAQVEEFLAGRKQTWREDSTNSQLAYTRNRIRHELLPELEGWNPRVRGHLAQMAVLARDEEAYWQAELGRIGPQLLLGGRPVRGGGRAASEGLAIDVTRLGDLAPALQRRLLRYAAGKLGAAPDFAATESLRTLALSGRSGQKLELEHGLCAERTARELRLDTRPLSSPSAGAMKAGFTYEVPIPGEVEASEFGIRLRIETSTAVRAAGDQGQGVRRTAILRNWRPGDRVKLRHSSGPRKIKEVLERLQIRGSSRAVWPVLELDGNIVWMQGVEVDCDQGFTITAAAIDWDSDERAGGSGPD